MVISEKLGRNSAKRVVIAYYVCNTVSGNVPADSVNKIALKVIVDELIDSSSELDDEIL